MTKAVTDDNRNDGGGAISDFQLYYRPIEIKIVWYWYKIRRLDQCNKVGDMDLNPCTY